MNKKILIAIVATCLCITSCIVGDSWRVGSHTQTGVIIQSGYSGAFWQTYEGKISLGFTHNGTGTVSTGDNSFCVDDSSLIPQIEAARENGKPVRLSIDQRMLTKPWHCESNSIVRKVDYIE